MSSPGFGELMPTGVDEPVGVPEGVRVSPGDGVVEGDGVRDGDGLPDARGVGVSPGVGVSVGLGGSKNVDGRSTSAMKSQPLSSQGAAGQPPAPKHESSTVPSVPGESSRGSHQTNSGAPSSRKTLPYTVPFSARTITQRSAPTSLLTRTWRPSGESWKPDSRAVATASGAPARARARPAAMRLVVIPFMPAVAGDVPTPPGSARSVAARREQPDAHRGRDVRVKCPTTAGEIAR